MVEGGAHDGEEGDTNELLADRAEEVDDAVRVGRASEEHVPRLPARVRHLRWLLVAFQHCAQPIGRHADGGGALGVEPLLVRDELVEDGELVHRPRRRASTVPCSARLLIPPAEHQPRHEQNERRNLLASSACREARELRALGQPMKVHCTGTAAARAGAHQPASLADGDFAPDHPTAKGAVHCSQLGLQRECEALDGAQLFAVWRLRRQRAGPPRLGAVRAL